jgi:hypothetical protein
MGATIPPSFALVISFCLLTHKVDSLTPTVLVSGGGPAGLFTALLLGRRGIDVSVFEANGVEETWTDRSYFISINARGQRALSSAGILESLRKEAIPLRGFLKYPDMPSEPAADTTPSAVFGISRPRLVQYLSRALIAEGNAKIVRGAQVTDIHSSNDGALDVRLSDNTALRATHVVAADGKWSAVRAAAMRHEVSSPGSPSFICVLRQEQYWGVRLRLDRPIPGYTLPPGYAAEMEPLTGTPGIRALLVNSEGPLSHVPWLMLYEPILSNYPELTPSAETGELPLAGPQISCPDHTKSSQSSRARINAQHTHSAAVVSIRPKRSRPLLPSLFALSQIPLAHPISNLNERLTPWPRCELAPSRHLIITRPLTV